MHYQRLRLHGSTDLPERPDAMCTIEGCTKAATALGWCPMHYQRWRATGDPLAKKKTGRPLDPFADRFWSKVDRSGGDDTCWPWLGGVVPMSGYGAFWVAERSQNVGAHRVAYELVRGPIPEGLQLDHLCRNRLCVNPSHLEAVTAGVNIRRGVSPGAVNAAKTHCMHGHPFDEQNTQMTPDGKRACRTCGRERMAAWRAARHP